MPKMTDADRAAAAALQEHYTVVACERLKIFNLTLISKDTGEIVAVFYDRTPSVALKNAQTFVAADTSVTEPAPKKPPRSKS